PPLFGAAARFLSAVVMLYIYIKWKRIPLRLTAREFRILLFTAFLIYAGDYGLIYWGEQYLSAGVASIFFAPFTMFTALLSNFVFKSEAFNWKKFAGLLIGLGGILTVFYDQLVITKFESMIVLASLAILVAALSAAISAVVIKKHLAGLDPVTLTFHQMAMGTVILILLGFILENPADIRLTLRVVTSVVYMGLTASAAAFVIYYRLLKHMSVITLSLVIYVIPITALIVDYLFFGEILSFRSSVGMFIIFAGIWLSQRQN
ncbi:MAG: DMT family transporter, partial [bacterium]|nr:DMT family transporter [bacterium]